MGVKNINKFIIIIPHEIAMLASQAIFSLEHKMLFITLTM